MATTGTLALPSAHTTSESVHYALGTVLLGIPLERYILAFFAIVLGLILRRVLIYVLERYRNLQKPRWLRLDERIVQQSSGPLGSAVAVLGVLGAVKALGLPQGLDTFATNVVISVFILDAAWLLFNLTEVLVGYLERFARRPETRLDEQLLPILRKSLKVFIVILAILQVVDQMGGDVKGLIAGLGLGGLAFALAARDSISNIFGSVVILADRPFRVGDWIEAQGQGIEGIVEEIGFRSTRIRTFTKSLLTVPNSVVANWAVNNWSAMNKRRAKVTIRVTPDAAPQQLEGAVAAIRDVLRQHAMVDQEEPAFVRFTDFAETGLQILVDYFTATKDYAVYLGVREEVNFAILRILADHGLKISLAPPPAATPPANVISASRRADEKPIL